MFFRYLAYESRKNRSDMAGDAQCRGIAFRQFVPNLDPIRESGLHLADPLDRVEGQALVLGV